jgi:TPR repeat protein
MYARLLLLLWALPATAAADYAAGASAHERGDHRLALAYLVPAADQDARAALLLADMFERGAGVERNPQQALLWRRRAAELGDPQAQFALANRYLKGTDVPSQPREAAVWFERAAQQGHSEARFALGRMLAEGDGVAPDPVEGRRLIERAADEGVPAAQQWLGLPGGATSESAQMAQRPHAEPARETPAVEPGDVRVAPDIRWHWGVHSGWHSGAWYGFDWYQGPPPFRHHPWGWYPYGWYPYAWHSYGWHPHGWYRSPGSSIRFGFSFGN